MTATFELLVNSTYYYAEAAYDFITLYIDIDYWQWLACVFYPLVVTFLLPLLILIGVYISGIFLHFYRLRHLLREVYTKGDFWDGARKFLAALWDAQGKIWHGILPFKSIKSLFTFNILHFILAFYFYVIHGYEVC